MYSYIVLHHSLTKDSETVSWDAIRNYHVNVLGWRDIGYHFGIELINQRYEILLGRMLGDTGAHCKEQKMNHIGIGICMVGNFDISPPTVGQRDLCLKLCKMLMKLYGIPVDHITGHGDFATYKTCPGKLFSLADFRGDLM